MDTLITEPRVEEEFLSHAPGFWSHVPLQEWNDWKWQLKNRVTTLEGLERHLKLSPEERAGVLLSGNKLALAVTPHYFNLIDPGDPGCPIRRQIIPHVGEGTVSPSEMADPCGEDDHMPVPGLVHRYPDRVLFLVTDRCASYCRYCTRSRVVSGAGEQELRTDFDQAIAYLEKHPEVRDVLLSGGDPFMVLADFRSYADCQKRVDAAYRDRAGWARKAILNTARVGKFSSDRTVREYAKDIWNLTPFAIP